MPPTDCENHRLLALAITTGMCQGEIFALHWDDIDLAGGTVYVKKTLTEDLNRRLVRSEPKTQKQKSRRVLYLPALACDALAELTRDRTPGSGRLHTE